MTVDEARKAVKNHTIVQWKDDPNNWGYFTCLSDDESIAYFHPKGCGFFKHAVDFTLLELGE